MSLPEAPPPAFEAIVCARCGAVFAPFFAHGKPEGKKCPVCLLREYVRAVDERTERFA
jgi:hypothetical protein